MLLLGLATQILSQQTNTTLNRTDITLNLTEPIDTKIGFELSGEGASPGLGYPSTNLGDVNGDAVDDIAISDQDTNTVYIIYGKEGGPNSSYSISDITSDPTKGFIIWTDSDYGIGRSVSAGDFNKDGLADILVGARYFGENSGGGFPVLGSSGTPGAVFIIYGRQGNNTESLNVDWITPTNGTTLGSLIEGDSNYRLGYSVSYAGDVNGDKVDDIILGTQGNRAYIIYGKEGGIGHLNITDVDDDTTLGYYIFGDEDNDELLGGLVSSAGDVNGDGIADLLLGSPDYGNNGAVTIFYGIQGTATEATSVDVNITQGFRIFGSNDAYLPVSLNSGDLNGDGVSDVILGSYASVYVIYGKKDGGISSLNISDLTTSQGFKISANEDDYVGEFVTCTDFDGDGISDAIVGAPMNSSLYIIYGKEGGLEDVNVTNRTIDNSVGIKITGVSENQLFGIVASAGDFNGDRGKDLIIAAVAPEGSGDATIYVLYGEPPEIVEVVSKDDGLSGGQIAGIVIGAVAAVVIVVGAVLTYKKWPCRNSRAKKFAEVPQTNRTTTNPTNAV